MSKVKQTTTSVDVASGEVNIKDVLDKLLTNDDVKGLILELLDGAYEQGYNTRLAEETQKSDGCSCGFFPCRHYQFKPKKGKK